VLVAVDGSPAAETALPLAHAVAVQLDARLVLFHAIHEPGSATALRHRIAADQGTLAQLALDAPLGDPADRIVARANDPAVALVILTTHGRTIDPTRALGHVAATVIARAMAPILLVRPEAIMGQTGPLRRLLAPLDGTPLTAGALAPVAALAAQLGATVDLLFVAAGAEAATNEPGTLSLPRYVDQAHHEWPHWAAKATDHLRACCTGWPTTVPVRTFITHGEVGPAIVRFAADERYDAIILARRSRFQPGRAKVLREVLAHAACPILLVGVPLDPDVESGAAPAAAESAPTIEDAPIGVR
jgi:nucleotide-binding universal stress UspA family protein